MGHKFVVSFCTTVVVSRRNTVYSVLFSLELVCTWFWYRTHITEQELAKPTVDISDCSRFVLIRVEV